MSLRSFASSAGALLLLLEGQAVAYLPAPYGGTISAPLPDAPVTLEPARATRESELQIIALLFDPLYLVGADGAPRPHLVEPQPEVTPDGRTWRLRLRPAIRLTGGRPLVAADVVASLRRVKKGPSAYLLAAVRALDSDGAAIVVVHLSRKTPELPTLLAAPATGIAAQHCGQNGCTPPVGTGPFRLHARTPTLVHLKANPGHFAGRPYIDELRLLIFDRASSEVASFQVGNLQLSLHGTSVFGGKPRYASTEIESAVVTPVFLGLGRAKTFLADPAFRLALLKGVDRRRLGRLVGVGRAEVADGPVTARLLRGAGTSGVRPVAFDRTAANRLLARLATQNAALRAEATGGRIKLGLLVDASRFEDAMVAGQLVADLDRLGIAAAIETRPAAEYQARLEEGRYELALGRHVLQVPLGAAALAGALAAAGDRSAAQRCLAGGRCGAKEAALFMRRLPFVPLVHASRRVFYDVRLGALRLTTPGLVGYADLFWTRRFP